MNEKQGLAKTKPKDFEKWRATQIELRKQYTQCTSRPSKINKWAQPIIEVNIQLVKQSNGSSSSGRGYAVDGLSGAAREENIRAFHDELSKLKQQYWCIDKKVYILEEEFPSAPLVKT
jgi:hypothetical protein